VGTAEPAWCINRSLSAAFAHPTDQGAASNLREYDMHQGITAPVRNKSAAAANLALALIPDVGTFAAVQEYGCSWAYGAGGEIAPISQ
jgi:hypothetical protein